MQAEPGAITSFGTPPLVAAFRSRTGADGLIGSHQAGVEEEGDERCKTLLQLIDFQGCGNTFKGFVGMFSWT